MSSAETPLAQTETAAFDLGAYRHERSKSYLIKRGLWALFQPFFAAWTPRHLSPLRIFLLRAFGARIGPGCLVNSGVRVWDPWNLEMAGHVWIGAESKIYNLAPIRIGPNSIVSQYSYLCASTHDYLDPSFPLYSKPITIGAGVWVAANVFVAPGVTIHDGAVVGACSVVTRDVPPNSVCAGNPCRFIKPRFPEKDGASKPQSRP